MKYCFGYNSQIDYSIFSASMVEALTLKRLLMLTGSIYSILLGHTFIQDMLNNNQTSSLGSLKSIKLKDLSILLNFNAHHFLEGSPFEMLNFDPVRDAAARNPAPNNSSGLGNSKGGQPGGPEGGPGGGKEPYIDPTNPDRDIVLEICTNQNNRPSHSRGPNRVHDIYSQNNPRDCRLNTRELRAEFTSRAESGHIPGYGIRVMQAGEFQGERRLVGNSSTDGRIQMNSQILDAIRNNR